MKLTNSQRRAVEHRGSNLVVAASAGSGKTEVLAQRVASLLADPRHPCGIDQLLVVTFTRAAASELRQRIGAMLRSKIAAAPPSDRARLRRAALLIDAADIGTFDSWCQRLVRANFAQIGVDPAFSVFSPQEAALLRRRVLDELLDWACTADEPPATFARDWLGRSARLDSPALAEAVVELNRFRDHLVNPVGWLARQREQCSAAAGDLGRAAETELSAALAEELSFQREQLALSQPQTPAAIRAQIDEYARSVDAWLRRLSLGDSVVDVVGEISTAKFPPKPRKLSDADKRYHDAVKERWFEKRLKKPWGLDFVRPILEHAAPAADLLRTVIDLEQRFAAQLMDAKRAAAAYEFGDVQRFALDLLGAPADGATRTPTPLARAIAARYEHVLVDEFQDTSPAQVALLRLISRPAGEDSNLFVVGDVKQSIYGFREAEPRLLAEMRDAIRSGREPGAVQPLADNFRSHKDLLDALNVLFERLFDERLGGVAFDADEKLNALREELPNATLDGRPRMTIDLLVAEPRGAASDDDESADDSDSDTQADGVPLAEIEREAQVIAERIRRHLADGTLVLDRRGDDGPRLRPARFADFVVLLRAAAKNAGLLAAQLRDAGIPAAAVGRESLLDSREVTDVRMILALLVNRRQDIPLAAFLRSPIIGATAAELLAVRRTAPGASFADALDAYLSRAGGDDASARKLRRAVELLDRWRCAARDAEPHELVRGILADSGLTAIAAGLPQGDHRTATLHTLEEHVREFSRAGGRGVAELVAYLDGLLEEQISPPAASAAQSDVVQVMTIHAAKGLEFPIVFLAGAGAAFSRRPHPPALLADERIGVGLMFDDLREGRRLCSPLRPRLKESSAARTRDEELRLIYVAATRAQEALHVVGQISMKRWLEVQAAAGTGAARPTHMDLAAASSALEWFLLAAAQRGIDSAGNCRGVQVQVREAADPDSIPAKLPIREFEREPDLSWLAPTAELLSRPFEASVARLPSVVSVSELKRQAGERELADAPRTLDLAPPLGQPRFVQQARSIDGRDVGTAVHRFLQHADHRRLSGEDCVRAEIARLVAAGAISATQAELVCVEDVAWYGRSAVARLTAESRRLAEQPFVYALPVERGDDRLIIRGVIDCLLDTADGLVLIDYKSDRKRDEDDWRSRLAGYRTQLQCYALAASAILARPIARLLLVFLGEREIDETSFDPSSSHSLLHALRETSEGT